MQPKSNEIPEPGPLSKWSRANPTLFYTALAMLVALFFWAILASISLGMTKFDLQAYKLSSTKASAVTKAEYETKLANARMSGLRQTAEGIAAALAPFVALQGQVPEITNRSLQATVRNLVQNRDLRFVALTDASGKVVAASDLTLVGRPMTAPSGMEIATAQIGTDRSRGSVTLGLR